MSKMIPEEEKSQYRLAFDQIEDNNLKNELKVEMCVNYGWSNATFYNKINSRNLPPKIAKEFFRLVNLYLQRV